jgi:sugar fermentation stimulation protein A
MKFKSALIKGKFIRRYKRFMADIQLMDGTVIVAHTANSGSMKTCLEEGAEVYLTYDPNPNRKTHYTWEMIKIGGGWVGINTSWPNLIAYEAIANNQIDELSGYGHVEREVKFGDSRFDIFCSNSSEKCFVEVKNVTLKEGNLALFPDAITSRGLKHLNTLCQVKKEGYRAVMLYVVQRVDVEVFTVADKIDPEYAKGLKNAMKCGVEVLVYQVKVSPEEIEIFKKLPINI